MTNSQWFGLVLWFRMRLWRLVLGLANVFESFILMLEPTILSFFLLYSVYWWLRKGNRGIENRLSFYSVPKLLEATEWCRLSFCWELAIIFYIILFDMIDIWSRKWKKNVVQNERKSMIMFTFKVFLAGLKSDLSR